MSRRRSRAKENPSAGMWLAIGLGVTAAGVGIYFLTKPKAPAAATTINPSTGQPLTAAQQAALNAQIAQANADAAAAMANLLGEGAAQNNAVATSGDTSGTTSTSSGPVNTGIPQVDNAANNAASQLGF